MKKGGLGLIALGIVGNIYILLHDRIVGKPAELIRLGPKSYLAMAIMAVFLIIGIVLVTRKGEPSA